MAVMVGISVYVRQINAGKNFVSSYFVGNRQLGGFVLAEYIALKRLEKDELVLVLKDDMHE